MPRLNNQRIRIHLGLLLASVFAAWGAYLIHVVPIEQPSLPILEALVDLSGRAPDQYRVIPYLLIGFIRDLINLLPGIDVELRYPVLIFDSLFLFLSIMALRVYFSEVGGEKIVWYLLLAYPFLMFDGYRPTASFILFLSIQLVALMRNADAGKSNAWWYFAGMIVVMSFTRADVAFLLAVSALGLANASMPAKAAIAAIPLVVQFLLSTVIFAEAEYFSRLIMLADNLSLRFLMTSPLTYLVFGLLLFYWTAVAAFVRRAAKTHRVILLAMAGYVLTLLVIARPNEYRLFLPFLPLVLWMLQESNRKTAQE